MNELEKVERWLKDNEIVYERIDDPFDWKNHHQIIVYKDGEFLWDVIWNRYSYGHEQGLLEMMWDGAEDCVEGWLTAEDVIERARMYIYKSHNINEDIWVYRIARKAFKREVWDLPLFKFVIKILKLFKTDSEAESDGVIHEDLS